MKTLSLISRFWSLFGYPVRIKNFQWRSPPGVVGSTLGGDRFEFGITGYEGNHFATGQAVEENRLEQPSRNNRIIWISRILAGFGSGFCCGIRGSGWASREGVEKVATLLSISSRFWNDYETAFSVVFTLPRYTNSYIYIGRWSWFFGKADWGNTSGGEIYFRTKENANWTVPLETCLIVLHAFPFSTLWEKDILWNVYDPVR